MFIPLKGASFDGHKFIDVAVENGAVAVISQEEINTTVPVIMVEDPRRGQPEPNRRSPIAGLWSQNAYHRFDRLLQNFKIRRHVIHEYLF